MLGISVYNVGLTYKVIIGPIIIMEHQFDNLCKIHLSIFMRTRLGIFYSLIFILYKYIEFPGHLWNSSLLIIIEYYAKYPLLYVILYTWLEKKQITLRASNENIIYTYLLYLHVYPVLYSVYANINYY